MVAALIPTVDDAIKFPIKALRTTSRRAALGDPAEKQYFGTTSGVFAGIPWTFEQEKMILNMGGKEWQIVVLPNVRGTRGTRAYVKVGGKLFNNLLILNGRVGTRTDLKYKSQDFLSPYERREWKKSKRERVADELRPLKDEWQDPASYGIKKKKTRRKGTALQCPKARSGSTRRSGGSSSRARKAPPVLPRGTKRPGSSTRGQANGNAVGRNGRSTTEE